MTQAATGAVPMSRDEFLALAARAWDAGAAAEPQDTWAAVGALLNETGAVAALAIESARLAEAHAQRYPAADLSPEEQTRRRVRARTIHALFGILENLDRPAVGLFSSPGDTAHDRRRWFPVRDVQLDLANMLEGPEGLGAGGLAILSHAGRQNAARVPLTGPAAEALKRRVVLNIVFRAGALGTTGEGAAWRFALGEGPAAEIGWWTTWSRQVDRRAKAEAKQLGRKWARAATGSPPAPPWWLDDASLRDWIAGLYAPRDAKTA